MINRETVGVGVQTAAAGTTSPMQRWWRLMQAPAGIFGTIVGASVLASQEGTEELSDVALAVVITLIIYWLAERWSELLGRRLRGENLSRRQVVSVFWDGWPIVQASYTPLVVLLVCWLVGTSTLTAINAALVSTVVVLGTLGVAAAHRVGIYGRGAAISGVFTGSLGFLMIVLKALLH